MAIVSTRMLIALAPIAIPMLGAPAFAQDAQAALPANGTLLEINATGTSTRVPDIATIRAGVVSQAQTAAAALADNAQRMKQVLAALKRAGVADRDVQTTTISLSPQYRYGDNQPPVITGYQAANTVSVRFRDIAKSGSILDALVAQGANQIDGPSLEIDSADAALDEARTDAVRKARQRAQLYATAAGLKVDRIVSISEAGSDSGPRPPMPMMARMESAADTKIAAGERQVSATITVRFLLD